jgi:PhoPQ-activated pathogenicity-related protein
MSTSTHSLVSVWVPGAVVAALLCPLFHQPTDAAEPATAATIPARTALDDYIATPDAAYRWKVVETVAGPGFRTVVVDMVSQSWRKSTEVDRTEWQHFVVVVVPEKVKYDKALLLIGGGRNGRDPPSKPSAHVTAIAVATGAVVAELGMVPNQPLSFSDDGRPRVEDDLIAHTWNKFMDTGDPLWAARLPMVKSAVRAMDTIQALLATPEAGGIAIKEFVVAGGSKRGWTTWLTGVVDKRVTAILPIVIDVLNVVPSMEHHYAAYGYWAPAIGDYKHNGIMDRRNDPRYAELLALVDPYAYRHRLTMPKLMLSSAGDQFFLPDSSQFYFDDLVGEKYLRYVPNSDHSLRKTDAPETIEAYFRTILTGQGRPSFAWKFVENGGIQVTPKDTPTAIRVWEATNPKARDFRLETVGKIWTHRALPTNRETFTVYRKAPAEGWTAFFVELTFDIGGPNPLKLTSGVRVAPETLPFAGKLADEDAAKAATKK